MERADAGPTGGVFQADRPVRMGIDPQRGFHGAAAVAGGEGASLARLAGDRFDKTARQQWPISSRPMSLLPICRRLRQLAEHHQFRQRRRAAGLPDRGAVAERLDQFALKKNDRHSSPQTCSCVQLYSSPDGRSALIRTSSWTCRASAGRNCLCAHRRSSDSDAVRRTAGRQGRRAAEVGYEIDGRSSSVVAVIRQFR